MPKREVLDDQACSRATRRQERPQDGDQQPEHPSRMGQREEVEAERRHREKLAKDYLAREVPPRSRACSKPTASTPGTRDSLLHRPARTMRPRVSRCRSFTTRTTRSPLCVKNARGSIARTRTRTSRRSRCGSVLKPAAIPNLLPRSSACGTGSSHGEDSHRGQTV
jgi:hypothetical protein